jgi:putative holliday junction resolvase
VKLLGVDYGRSRTGLAVSDPVGITCRPLCVLTEKDSRLVVDAILVETEGQGAEGIVVGLPRPLSGGTNQQMQDVLEFVDGLRARSPVPVDTWDERFTSSLAERGSKGDRPRDAVAACYMLQNYLDRKSAERGGRL